MTTDLDLLLRTLLEPLSPHSASEPLGQLAYTIVILILAYKAVRASQVVVVALVRLTVEITIGFLLGLIFGLIACLVTAFAKAVKRNFPAVRAACTRYGLVLVRHLAEKPSVSRVVIGTILASSLWLTGERDLFRLLLSSGLLAEVGSSGLSLTARMFVSRRGKASHNSGRIADPSVTQ